jgi:transposase
LSDEPDIAALGEDHLSLAPCDMRKGFDGLSAQVRNILQLDPFSGAVFLFRGKRGDRLKALVWDGSGLCLYAKRLERGKFVWPRTRKALLPGSLARNWRC